MALSLKEPGAALALADDAAGRLKERGLTAEVFLRGGAELSVVYDPTTGRAVESAGGAVRATCRVWREGRCGVATADVEGVEELLGLAGEAHARAPAGPQAPVPGPGAAPVDVRAPEAEPSGARALQLARAMAGPLAARGGRFQAVLVRQAATWSVLASTGGARALDVHPSERGLLRYETARGAVLDGVAGPLGAGPLDTGPMLARLEAALEAVAGEGGAPEPGLPWALRPQVAAPLVSGMAWLLRGDVAGKTPGLLKAVGRKIFPSALTLLDDASPPGAWARRVDDEGQPVAPLKLVDEGRLSAFLHSTGSAAALQAPPNGRGLRPSGQGEPAPAAHALRAVAGTGAPPPDRNELDARLETFTSMARPARVTLVVAGWLIRGGERVRRIAPLELELPVLDTFRRLLAVDADLACLPGVEGCSTPTLTFAPLPGKAD